MDVFEQSKWASVKEFKKSLKSVGKDGLKKTNEKGQTLLHTAAEGGNHEALKLLLTSKYKLAHLVNTKDGFGGWTPLHYAADGGHLECLDLLISHGADVTAASRDGDVPLHYLVRAKARQADNVHYYKLLKTVLNSRGLDVNVQNMNGEAALHLSAMGGHDEVANLLLNHGAEINVKSRVGETPLHYATRYGHTDVVKTLLERNADPTLVGPEGTPLNIAVAYHKEAVAELLSGALAKTGRKNSAPVLHAQSGLGLEERHTAVLPAVTSFGTHSAPMPAVSYSPKSLPPVPRSTSFDVRGQNGHHTDQAWPVTMDGGLPAGHSLLQFCRVAVCPSRGAAASRPPNAPVPSPAALSAFLAQVDSALATRSQRGSLGYEFTYERDILTHIEKEREAFRLTDELRKDYEERRRAGTGGVASAGSPFGGASPGVHAGGSPFGGAPTGMTHSPYTPPPTHTGMPASPYAGPGPSFQPQIPMHQPLPLPQPQPFLPAGPHNGGPYMVPPHSAPSPHLHGGGGLQPATESLATFTNKHSHPLHMARQKSGSTGDIQRTSAENARSPRGGVPVLPRSESTGGHRSRSSSGSSVPRKHTAPLNPVQEKLYLKVISEHETLNTEHVHIAARHCANDPKSVIAYVKAYERLKHIGYSQAHVVEALKAYGGGAAGLSPQEEDQQHQRMLAFLKLLVNKGFSPAAQVQNTLSLFDYDVDKAEKFLSSYKTVSQLGFSDVQVREALLMSDSDSELAIRYLLEGK